MKNLVEYFAITAILCTLAGCKKKMQGTPTLERNIKWGFTTCNFLSAIPVSLESSLQYINFAKEQGYSWIELRDPNAELSKDECRKIAVHAEQSGIAVVYSIQRGLLTPDFKQVVQRGFENSTLFKGPPLLRVLALRDQHPLGWTESEFKAAFAMANMASELAGSENFRLMIENADVVLDGKKHNCFGLTQLLDALNPTIELQLDTANIFTGPAEVSPEEAEVFIRKYASRISYVHVKSARDMTALPILNGNPLKFKTILDILTENGKSINAAIELSSKSDDPDEIYKNMKTSQDWLRKK
ncbi:MAG: TIM barrel protein [Kiritimatiellae bacterium]|jgi:sugar phosphate isomerase/epimerase|nr:TIM barrel protein [Kiritimatiellia bacterium]